MEFTPYLDSLHRHLAATAAAGGPDVERAAELIDAGLDAGLRLALLELLSDASAEITAQLHTASVEVRMRGREPELVVVETAPEAPMPPPTAPPDDSGETARLTLRLPESLKQRVEDRAAAERVSVNAWLVRAISAALAAPLAGSGATSGPAATPGRRAGKRISGFAQT